MPATEKSRIPPLPGRWRWWLVFGFALAAFCWGAAAGIAAEKQRVQLVVDFGDGVQKHFTNLAWKEGLTVLDAVKAAEKHPRGIEVKVRGSGAIAFLTQIDDVKNEGGRGRNWIFRVNGKLADRSCGVFPLKPGDTILWRFQEYE